MAFKMAGKSPMVRASVEDRIRNRKKGTVANVTSRLNEGNIKGARLARRMNVAASKGNAGKRSRLARKVASEDSRWAHKSNEAREEAKSNAEEKPGKHPTIRARF